MSETAGGDTGDTRVRFGVGRAQGLAADIADLAGPSARVLLITDQGLARSPVVAAVRAALDDPALGGTALGLTTHADIPGEPSAADIDAATARAVATKADVILAVGGGSVIDVAKFVAALAPDAAAVAPFALAQQPLPTARLPLIALPTTAGTGAEVTRTSIFALADGTKVWAWGSRLNPDLAVLDPSLTVSLPPALTIACGVDALVHAVEATTNRTHARGIDLPAMAAIAQIRHALPQALADPADVNARGHMLYAACLAGHAIDRAGTGVAHAIGHALGSLAHVPHGRAVGLGLRAALGWNAEAAPAPHAAVADAFGVAQAPDASDEARALALATAFDDFLRQVGMDLDLAGDGLAARDADRVAEAILRPENSPMLASNCRSVDAAGAARLSRNLFAGP